MEEKNKDRMARLENRMGEIETRISKLESTLANTLAKVMENQTALQRQIDLLLHQRDRKSDDRELVTAIEIEESAAKECEDSRTASALSIIVAMNEEKQSQSIWSYISNATPSTDNTYDDVPFWRTIQQWVNSPWSNAPVIAEDEPSNSLAPTSETSISSERLRTSKEDRDSVIETRSSADENGTTSNDKTSKSAETPEAAAAVDEVKVEDSKSPEPNSNSQELSMGKGSRGPTVVNVAEVLTMTAPAAEGVHPQSDPVPLEAVEDDVVEETTDEKPVAKIETMVIQKEEE